MRQIDFVMVIVSLTLGLCVGTYTKVEAIEKAKGLKEEVIICADRKSPSVLAEADGWVDVE